MKRPSLLLGTGVASEMMREDSVCPHSVSRGQTGDANGLVARQARIACLVGFFLALASPQAAQAALTSLWESRVGDFVRSSPALGPDGTLLIGSGSRKLVALRPNGELRWEFLTAHVVAATPAVASDGTAYVGDYAGKFYAVSAEGTRRWEVTTGGPVVSSAAIAADGAVCFGSFDGKLYCCSPAGEMRWSFPTGGEVESSPAITREGLIVFGCASGSVFALGADGVKQWSYPVGAEVRSSPALGSDGTIYFGANDAKLYALSPAGALKWTYDTSDPFEARSPVIAPDGTIVVASGNTVLAVSPAGARRWSYLGGGFRGSPAVGADGSVFIMAVDSKLIVLTAAGALMEEFPTGALSEVSPLLTPEGTLFTSANHGYVFAIGGASPPAASSWPLFRRGPARTAAADPAPSVTIVMPGDGLSFRAGQPVPLRAQVANFGAGVRVEFRVDGELVGSATTAPYASVWTPSTTGTKQLTATATDDAGTAATSAPVTLHLLAAGANQPPQVTLTNPSAGATLSASDQVTLTAQASDPDGIVTEVEFFADGISLGKASYPVFSFDWRGLASGLHTLSAVATDNSGASTISAGVTVAVLVRPWEFTAPGGGRSAPAIARDGTIYVGTGGGDNKLYAVNPNGSQRWAFQAGSEIHSAPAVGGDGTIYFGSFDFKLYALNPDGTKKWEFVTGGVINSSPALGPDGTIHVGSFDYKLYAVNPSGTRKWAFETGFVVTASPAVAADGTVYIGGGDGKFYAVNPDGSKRWDFNVGPNIGSSPALGAGGTIYFGADDNKVYALNPDGSRKWAFATGQPIGEASPVIGPDGEIYVGSQDGRLYALNSDGTKRWHFATGGEIRSTPAVSADGTVYVTSTDKNLYALDRDGARRWQFATAVAMLASPALGLDGALYFTAGDKLYAVLGQAPLAASPWPMFHHDPQHTGRGLAQPVVQLTSPTDGANFVTGDTIVLEATASSPNGAITKVEFFAGGNLLSAVTALPYRFEWKNATPGTYALTAKATDAVGANKTSAPATITVTAPSTPPSITQQPQGQTVNNGAEVTLVVAATGSQPLSYQWLKDSAPINGATGTSLVLRKVSLADSAHYAVVVSNAAGSVTSAPATVNVLQPVTKLWDQFVGRVHASPAIGTDGTLYVTGFGYLHALNADGSIRWSYGIGGSTIRPAPVIGYDGTVYFGAYTRKLYALNPDGTKKWEFDTGDFIDDSAAIAADGTIYFGGDSKKLYALNPDGSVKWALDTTNAITSSPAIGSDGRIYMGSGKDLLAVSPQGARLWQFSTANVIESSPAIGADGTVYFGSTDKKLYALNPDGTKKWDFATGGPIQSSPAIGPDGTVYIGTDGVLNPSTATLVGKLFAVNPDGTKQWEFTARDAVRSSPAIAEDGTIYFGANDSRVYALNANGTLKWEFITGDKVEAPPTLGPDGTVYVGAFNNTLFALRGSSGPAKSPWPMFRRDVRQRGRAGTGALPVVSLTAPANDGRFDIGANVQLTAAVTETDEPVERVEFFAGATLLGGASLSPYTITWNNTSAGNYALTAKAIDRLGNAATSSAVNIAVVPPVGVTITSPANGATFLSGDNITIETDTSLSARPVVRVDFYQGVTLLGSDASSPFSFTWSNVPAGDFVLTVKATNDQGATVTSSPVAITVLQRPPVRLTAPSEGENFTIGDSVTIAADASGSSKPVARVDFFVGVTLISTDASSPYSLAWSPTTPGPYVHTARLTDTSGGTATSAPVTIWVFAPGPQVIDYASFSSATGLILQEQAATTDNRLRLTSATASQRGAAWLNTKRYIAEGFEMTFEFQIANRSGEGGEGFAFVIQGNPTPLIGNGGNGLGYDGIPNSLAIEFDTRQNTGNGDPNAHHIGIHSRRTAPNSQDEAFSFTTFAGDLDFADGQPHRIHVTYAQNTLNLILEPFASPLLSLVVFFDSLFPLDDGQAWIGFTASTGSSAETHDILNWTFSSSSVKPTITDQPEDQRVVVGRSASFSVSATGAPPLSYQWRFKGADISGATSPALTLNDVQLADAGEYTVVVRNALGSTTSQPATLAVTSFGAKRWEFNATGAVQSSPGIGSDGTIYVASSGGSGTIGRIAALHPDGSVKWEVPNADPIVAALAVGPDGTIYLPVFSQLRARAPDGGSRWEFQAGDNIATSPAIGADGTIYFGSLDWRLYALRPDGTKKWHFAAGWYIVSSPAIDAYGTIYFGSHDKKLYALNPDGSKKWEFLTGHEIHSSPAIGNDGTIYVTSYDGKLYALNPDGTQKWASFNGGGDSSPALGPDGAIYVGRGRNLYAFSSSGAQKWTFATGDKVVCSPAVAADGTVCFGSLDGKFYALNADGTKRWDFAASAGFGESSPAIGPDGVVYVGSHDGFLYALNGSAPLADTAWPMFRRDLKRTGRLPSVGPPRITTQPQSQTVGAGTNVTFTVTAIGAEPLSYQWQRNGADLADGDDISGAKTPTLTITGTRLDQAGDYAVVVSNPIDQVTSTVAVLKVFPFFNPPGTKLWEFATGELIETSPAIGEDGTIYVGAKDKNLYAVNPDGTKKWAFTTLGGLLTSPVIGPAGTIYVGSTSLQDVSQASVYAVNPDGTRKWSLAVRSDRTPPAIAQDGTIYVAGFDGQLTALNPEGTKKWALATGGASVSAPAIGSDGTIYVGTGRFDPQLGFEVGDLIALYPDGTVKWKFTARGPFNAPLALGGDGTIHFGSAFNDGYLYALDSQGHKKWEFRTGASIQTAPVLGLDGTIYVADGNQVFWAFSPEGTRKWTFFTGSSAIPAAAVAEDGTIYLGAGDGNLYALSPTGEKLWAFDTMAGNNLYSAPAIGAQGEIYFSALNKLYAVQGSGKLAQSAWPMYQHDPRHTASAQTGAIVPTVSITSPSNQARFLPGQDLILTAQASGGVGGVVRVEWYAGTSLLGVATSAPFTLTWSKVTSGVYVLTAKATDQAGTTGLSGEVTVLVNAPPTVSLSSPADGTVFIEHEAILLRAEAADRDGSVVRVEFYDGVKLIGTVTRPPYELTLSELPADLHDLFARATDDLEASADSPVTTILVTARPTATLTSPADGTQLNAGGSVTIAATATDSDGPVLRVDFFDGFALLGSDSTAPFSLTLNNLVPRDYVLLARAVDQFDTTGMSLPVTLSVRPANQPPVVSFRAPFDGAVFVAPAEIELSAVAADPEGRLARVEFYADQTPLAAFTAAGPFVFSWGEPGPGDYVLRAQASDQQGATAVATARITVTSSSNPPAPPLQPATRPNPNFWVPDGEVFTILEHQGVVYVGGAFSHIGQQVPGSAVVELSASALDLSYPLIDGVVDVVFGDGEGGFYIGGLFKAIGGLARANLAHVRADKSVDLDFAASANGHVLAFALAGDTLYVGGEFTRFNEQDRRYLVALDRRTGALKGWDPQPTGWVSALALSGNTLYAGGDFRYIGGKFRDYLAAVDATTGLATPWNPEADNWVTQIVLARNRAYVAGWFNRIKGAARAGLAAIDLATGAPDAFNEFAEGGAGAIAVVGDLVYVGGAFGRMGGRDRNNLAALDAETGRATDWKPDVNGEVSDLWVAGSTLYLAGTFTAIDGLPRLRFATVDLATKKVTGLDLNASGRIFAFGESAGRVFGAGGLGLIRVPRKGLAALDAATGFATGWDARCDGEVHALVAEGHTLYVGGVLNSLGGQPRNGLGAVSTLTGLATPFDPQTGQVRALTLVGDTLLVGGYFNLVRGQSRNYLAAVEVKTGQLTPWNPNADDGVTSLVVADDTVFVAGPFTRVGGAARNHLAALNLFTGRPTAWNPDPNGVVNALAVTEKFVYAGGGFSRIGGEPRIAVAALDRLAGHATSWKADTDGGVAPIALGDGVLYVGGQFQTISGQPRANLATLDTRLPGANATEWNPKPGRNDSDPVVRAIAVTRSSVYIGGRFHDVDGQPQAFFAAFDLPTRVTSPLRLPSGLFRLNLIGPLGRYYVFEASTDLEHWTPIFTNRAPFLFEDVQSLNYPHRFYRAAPAR
ncbi:MAG: PQQ-binding-like beta-propeller repeat protein [Verrucomicrobia bacterium]|nr:PQQ-binding-like beta-propeller repeat protein [Verrucomicrobiota bacterium]